MKFKKLISCLLILTLLFNFLGNTTVLAIYDTSEEEEQIFQADTNMDVLDGIIGVLTWIPRVILLLIPMAVQGLTSLVGIGEGYTAGTGEEWKGSWFTVAHILFNKINLTDINIFDLNPQGARSVNVIRENIRNWYYAMFILAAIILLCILIYVGIRMAISTVAEKRAVYKQMLMNWFVSLVLLFMLHFIIRATIYVNAQLVTIFENANANIAEANEVFDNVTGHLITRTMSAMATVGWASLCVYICTVILTIMFLIMYVKRMITISFLIIIAPLITITYSIDKMGDNKSQALDTWLKEFMYGVLIQPFHCLIYLVYVSQAITLCSAGTFSSMILAVMMMFFIMQAEGIIRKIFGFEKASSLATGAMAGAAVMAGVNKLKDLGGKAKQAGKAVTKLKDRPGGSRGTGGANNNSNSGGSGGSGGSSSSSRNANGTRSTNTPNLNDLLIRGNKSKLGKAIGLGKKAIKGYQKPSATASGALYGGLIGGMTGQGVIAGATVGAAIGSSVGDKQNDLLNKASIARGKKVMGQAYNNLQDSTGYSDEEMTALTDNMLNDPEGLRDMQQMKGESNEDYMQRTMLKNEDGNALESERQWNDRMMYAQSLYSLQNKYQQAGIDGDVANDKIADAIRRRQNSNAHLYDDGKNKLDQKIIDSNYRKFNRKRMKNDYAWGYQAQSDLADIIGKEDAIAYRNELIENQSSIDDAIANKPANVDPLSTGLTDDEKERYARAKLAEQIQSLQRRYNDDEITKGLDSYHKKWEDAKGETLP